MCSRKVYGNLPGLVNSVEKYCEILSSDLNTIEASGGGSARCILAEVFFPRELGIADLGLFNKEEAV